MLSSLLKSFREKKPETEIATPDISRVLPNFRKTEETPEVQAPEAEPDRIEILDTAEAEDVEDEIDIDAWIARDVASLQTAFAAYIERPGREDVHRQLFLAAHNLRGAAGPYGRPAIARIAGSLCQLLEGVAADEPVVAIVKLHVDAVRAAAALPEGAAQEDLASAVCIALEDQVRARLA